LVVADIKKESGVLAASQAREHDAKRRREEEKKRNNKHKYK
jgi:hypothetical protein